MGKKDAWTVGVTIPTDVIVDADAATADPPIEMVKVVAPLNTVLILLLF
jgi:hypothetical protein